jgi:hypothetical protein
LLEIVAVVRGRSDTIGDMGISTSYCVIYFDKVHTDRAGERMHNNTVKGDFKARAFHLHSQSETEIAVSPG